MKLDTLQIIALSSLLAGCSTGSVSSTGDSTDSAQWLFETTRQKTEWDLGEDMAWGYYFLDTDPAKLARFGRVLSSKGYRVVDVLPPEDGDDDYFLHVEKIETHTKQSLKSRNSQLERLATQYGIDAYDGMDVGPVRN